MYSTSQGAATLSDLWRFIVHNPPPPLYRTVMFFWTKLFGEQELSVRMPSLLFGIFSIGLTYLIARGFSSRSMAVLAAILLCFSPVHVWYSQEATPYSMALFFLMAAMFMLVSGKTRFLEWKWCVAYFALLLAAVSTHSFILVSLFPLTIIAFEKDRPGFGRVVAVHLAVLLCFLTYLTARYASGELVTGIFFLRAFTLFEWWMLFFHWFLLGNSLWTVMPSDASLEFLFNRPALLLL